VAPGRFLAPTSAPRPDDEVEGATLTFPPEQVLRYLALAGDEVPIHRDDDAARRAGLEGTVVPGFLLAARMAAVAGGPARRIAARFRRPLPVGATATVSWNRDRSRVAVVDGRGATLATGAVSPAVAPGPDRAHRP
jgi:acyl dehydratase